MQDDNEAPNIPTDWRLSMHPTQSSYPFSSTAPTIGTTEPGFISPQIQGDQYPVDHNLSDSDMSDYFSDRIIQLAEEAEPYPGVASSSHPTEGASHINPPTPSVIW